MASPILRLTLAIFRATPTSIGCMPGRNQQYQSVAMYFISSRGGARREAGLDPIRTLVIFYML